MVRGGFSLCLATTAGLSEAPSRPTAAWGGDRRRNTRTAAGPRVHTGAPRGGRIRRRAIQLVRTDGVAVVRGPERARRRHSIARPRQACPPLRTLVRRRPSWRESATPRVPT